MSEKQKMLAVIMIAALIEVLVALHFLPLTATQAIVMFIYNGAISGVLFSLIYEALDIIITAVETGKQKLLMKIVEGPTNDVVYHIIRHINFNQCPN